MTRVTDLHGYTVPTTDDPDYDTTFDTLFTEWDTDISITDTESNLGNYTPKSDAIFKATDTGVIYVGDGTNWNPLPNVARPNGHIERTELASGNKAIFGIPVPDGNTLEVYRWGCWKQDNTSTDLNVVLLDESQTVQASASTDDSGYSKNVVASLSNSDGQLRHYYLGVENAGSDLLATDGNWVTAMFAYQVIA